jgi:hypothetical protein
MSVDYTTTQPATPTTGGVLFTRNRARRLPAYVGPSGLDTSLQPAIFANRVARLNAVNNSTSPSTDGLAFNAVGTAGAVALATTNFYSAMTRARYSSSATASTAGGIRSSSGQWFLSSTANLGGFFFVARFGLAVVPSSTQTQWFVGLSTTTGGALSATANPTSLFSLVGFGSDLTHTTMRFLSNDTTGTATSVDLGANFPSKTAATYFYEVRLFAPSGAGQSVYWSAQRLNDGAIAQGGPVTTDLPALNTLMALQINMGNGTQAAAASIDVQSVYIETDN